jgi:hypothetical protein
MRRRRINMEEVQKFHKTTHNQLKTLKNNFKNILSKNGFKLNNPKMEKKDLDLKNGLKTDNYGVFLSYNIF